MTYFSYILGRAQRGHYAVPACNTNLLESTQAIVNAAAKTKSPIIVQMSEGAMAYAGMEQLCATVIAVRHRVATPVLIHLDHGKDPANVERAIRSRLFDSVMFDGSALPYADNVRITKKIVQLAHRYNVGVEAELGTIRGKEDFVSVAERDAFLTNPKQAAEFVKKTECDALGVAIGTAHGAFKFKGTPTLDLRRLAAIRNVVSIPLVLHGASGVQKEWVEKLHSSCSMLGDCVRLSDAHGVPNALIKKAIAGGICKVNVDTDLRIAFVAGVRQALLDHPESIDPRDLMMPARTLMEKVVMQKIVLLGSAKKG